MQARILHFGSCFLLCVLYFSTANALEEKVLAGKVLMAVGSVEAVSAEKQILKRRSKIYVGDTIFTGQDSQAQLRMSDGALVSLGENAEFAVKEYSYNQEGKKDAVVLSVLKGGLRTITGKVDKSAYSMETPVATLGIRGTVFDIFVAANGETTVVLREGGVDVTGQVGEAMLLKLAGLATLIQSGGEPSKPGDVPAGVSTYLQSILPVPAGGVGYEQSGSGTLITVDIDPADIVVDPSQLQPPTIPDSGEVEMPPEMPQVPQVPMCGGEPCGA